MPIRPIWLTAGALAAAFTLQAAQAQTAHNPAPPSHANLQGNDEEAWIKDPHWHAFYDLTVATFGPAHASAPAAFDQKSQEIFREFALAHHMDPAKMQDHLKLIPGQVRQIVKEDPHVLDSYDNFVAATFGPR